MQPDNQRGYYQPDQNRPVQPVAPPQPTPIGAFTPTLDPAALQAALNEPAPAAPAPAPAPIPAPVAQAPAAPAPQPQPVSEQPPADDGADYDEDDNELTDEPITWSAQEYIHQEKGASWFIIFTIVVVVLLGVSIFLMKSLSFAALLGVIAAVVVVYSRRPPRELTYSLTNDGLSVDQTLHKFEAFKSFGVIRDGEEYSVMLIPTRRFQPGITVYFPEEAGEDIVDMLGSRLPMRDLHLDVIDHVVRLLRL